MSSMSADCLLVPIRVEALCLSVDTAVTEAAADFTRLPYCDTRRDFNPDIGYISEELVSHPFQNQNLFLKAGVHLHWFFPAALATGKVDADEGTTTFPAVPNRWLVTRFKNSEVSQWVVESDYLHKEGGEGSVAFPLPTKKPIDAPFRRIGRNMSLDYWLNLKNHPEDGQYLDPPLTAVGYGDPTFAAFYPNCHSVFGFYDEEFKGSIPDNVRYLVIGWYSNERDDFLKKYQHDFLTNDYIEQKGLKDKPEVILKFYNIDPDNVAKEEIAKGKLIVLTKDGQHKEISLDAFLQDQDRLSRYVKENGTQINQRLVNALKTELGWNLPEGTQPLSMQRMFCYGVVSQPTKEWQPEPEKIKIALANSGVEALSAYLADAIADGTTDSEKKKTCKKDIEEQLEFLSIQPKLANNPVDPDATFIENRHERSFNAVYGGSQWIVQPEQQDAQQCAVPAPDNRAVRMPLPEGIAGKLRDLNDLQREYDRTTHEITVLRQQLFSDWYKYMLCACPPEGARDGYPDIDKVHCFIQNQDLDPLIKRIKDNTTLKADHDSLEKSLVNALNEHNQSKGADRYVLKQVSASRYWQPKEPVVLVVDGAGSSLLEDNQAEPAGCLVVKDMGDALTEGALKGIANTLKGMIDTALVQHPRVSPEQWKVTEPALDIEDDPATIKEAAEQKPCHPLFLEWQVEFFPMANGNNVYPTNGDYAQEYITDNFELVEKEVELQKKSGQTIVPGAQIYSGRSILTPHAGIQLEQNVAKYIAGSDMIKDWNRDHPADQVDPSNDEEFKTWLSKQIDSVINWYSEDACKRLNSTPKPDPMLTFLCAFKRMQNNVFFSQALSGFNDALLMHKQTMQWSVADPLGFAEYQTFAKRVADAIADENKTAPQPLDEFNPIRAGALCLEHLRLIDTFGRANELVSSQGCLPGEVIASETLRTEGFHATLPPRLVQPARLNFRWLAAASDASASQQTNSHPATGPICGWLLPNLLDSSIMVYDSAGAALGSVTIDKPWQPAPGAPRLEVEDIANPCLQNVVSHIKEMKVEDFVGSLEAALERIAPENFAHNLGLALLIGQPVAVARASVELELFGSPAVHQGWNVFRQDMARDVHVMMFTSPSSSETCQRIRRLVASAAANYGVPFVEYDISDATGAGIAHAYDVAATPAIVISGAHRSRFVGDVTQEQLEAAIKAATRDTNAYERVKIPIRLGEELQLNDGLVGYWEEDEYGNLKANAEGKGRGFSFVSEAGQNLEITTQDPPKHFVLLLDPRATVHATCGLLPAKAIDIPAEHYSDTLKHLEVTFLSTPILTNAMEDKAYYVIVGPESDPAGITTVSAAKAFKKLYELGTSNDPKITFVSCGDQSDTHKKEQSIWQAAGYNYSDKIEKSGPWYVETGQGMDETLMVADQKQGYTISDKETYLAYKSTLTLTPLIGSELLDPLLTPSVTLPVPPEPGYVWRWVGPHEAHDITLPGPQDIFSAPQEIREGWLKLIPVPPP